jgi:DNA-binding response OmpR family regulator
MVSPTVLIVDDEEEFLTLLAIELSSEGYHVIKAHNGSQAVQIARDFKPDVIVQDILMPDLDGGQVIKMLKSQAATRHIPIIVLTAVVTKEEQAVNHLPVNIDDVIYPALAKPFNPKDLLMAIKKLIPS